MVSIFVRDLHPNVTESTLYQKFSSIGPLLSLRVCREADSNRSLGYAYVNFVDRIHANRAIETLNFEELEGRPIQVVRSERNPLLRKISEPNVFVKNLDRSVTNRELFFAFSQFGTVISSKVAKDQNGTSKCYGFVQLEDDDAAMRSISQLNGLLIKDKILCVQRFINKKMNGPEMTDDSKQSFTNVYVKNIGKDMNSQGLREMFENFGTIVSPKIMTESDGTSRGFGFVSFEDPKAAHNATAELNGQIMSSGKTLYVGRAQKKKERERVIKAQQKEFDGDEKRNLCVSNLDDTVDDNRLRTEFQPYGTVVTARVLMKLGRSIGIGYVCFSKRNDAIKAIAAMNGRIVGTKPIIVYLTDAKRTSFGEQRLLGVRPSLRPDLLEIANPTYQPDGIGMVTESNIPEERIEKRKPDMPMVMRLLSPPETVDARKLYFQRV